MRKAGRLPDFIIIGSMKSATSTLHNQLSVQPGIFMSSPKEPNFFSDEPIYRKGLDWYRGLFSAARDNDICGESSTHYTKLPDYPRTVQRLKDAINNPKLIYVMRHPVDRLVSHYIHQWSEGVINCDINKAIDRHPELISYSCYGEQMAPFVEAFGEEALLPVFFNDLKSAPQVSLETIGRFIGVPDPESLYWNEQSGRDNVSKNRIRRFYGSEFIINSMFMTWLRQTFIPQPLRDRIKGRLTMGLRPQLSESQLAKVTEIFDQDLKLLFDWFGFELSCLDFNDFSRIGK
ncbi:Sulfotransferase domain protein [Gammaproteobacteria bacterium MOLA455]|nr:Sulfotransferase domain protein [Gammaproteobacteria bacterium MOLA455]